MYRNIYIESEVLRYPRVKEILARYTDASVVTCDRYTEIFNLKSQDFRLQKKKPSLILARKHSGYIQQAPAGYGVGGNHNFYFSTMLNCLYDCRYCFLQGMYRSANHVVFVNYEDFSSALLKTAARFQKDEQVWFFSGYDCDSLALEPVLSMADYFIETVSTSQNIWLELRTKSTQIRSLLKRAPLPNIVTAFSFTPATISEQIEHQVPGVEKRLAAMLRLQEQGWSVGLRFDPLIYSHNFREQYQELFNLLFCTLNPDLIHSISIGVFRLPKDFYKQLERLYPDDRFIAQPFNSRNGQVSYPLNIELEMKSWCYKQLQEHIEKKKIYFAEISVPDSNIEDSISLGTESDVIKAS